jgi:hypothetical protein
VHFLFLGRQENICSLKCVSYENMIWSRVLDELGSTPNLTRPKLGGAKTLKNIKVPVLDFFNSQLFRSDFQFFEKLLCLSIEVADGVAPLWRQTRNS